MADTKKLGTELGDEFARERTLGSAQDREAKQLIDLVIAREPRIKLPRLLAHERVQAWQKETGVTDAQLKKALTNARADRKANPEPEPLRLPVRRRNRSQADQASAKNVSGPQTNDQLDARHGVVPNQDLTLL